MKKIVIIFILLGIFFAGCTFLEDTQKDQINSIQNNSQIKNTTVVEDIDSDPCAQLNDIDMTMCYSQSAIEKDDIEICEKMNINDSMQKQLSIDYCVAKFAFVKDAPEICENIQSATIKDACIMDLATKLNDERICLGASDPQNTYEGCYIPIVIEKNSTESCTQIKNEDYKNYCFAMLQNTQEDCAKIENNQTADSCTLKIVWEKKDSQICAQMREDMGHDVCLTAIASYKQNQTICENVRIEQNLQNCINEVLNPSFPLNG